MNDKMRDVGTGATRTADTGRYDPEGFLSPAVLERFCEYMNRHRTCADGSTRASDNWQKGMPKSVWMKGIWRHFLHLWTRHRGHAVRDPGAAANAQEDCCALMFGVMGYLSELLKDEATRREVVGELTEADRRAGLQEDHTLPQYQCVMPGCPGNHASKWQVCGYGGTD